MPCGAEFVRQWAARGRSGPRSDRFHGKAPPHRIDDCQEHKDANDSERPTSSPLASLMRWLLMAGQRYHLFGGGGEPAERKRLRRAPHRSSAGRDIHLPSWRACYGVVGQEGAPAPLVPRGIWRAPPKRTGQPSHRAYPCPERRGLQGGIPTGAASQCYGVTRETTSEKPTGRAAPTCLDPLGLTWPFCVRVLRASAVIVSDVPAVLAAFLRLSPRPMLLARAERWAE